MNFIQKLVLLAGIIVFTAMVVYPPWMQTENTDRYNNTKPLGYALITQPPKAESDARVYGVVIDKTRISIQLGACAVATFVLVLVFSSGKVKKQ